MVEVVAEHLEDPRAFVIGGERVDHVESEASVGQAGGGGVAIAPIVGRFMTRSRALSSRRLRDVQLAANRSHSEFLDLPVSRNRLNVTRRRMDPDRVGSTLALQPATMAG